MTESEKRLGEYRKTGYYYIATELFDLLWFDEIGEWTMNASATKMRSCMELDKVPQEVDETGVAIILSEFGIEPDVYEIGKIRHMNPLELYRLHL